MALIELAASVGLEELWTVVNPANVASVKILEKNGFKDAGPAADDLSHLRQYVLKLS